MMLKAKKKLGQVNEHFSFLRPDQVEQTDSLKLSSIWPSLLVDRSPLGISGKGSNLATFFASSGRKRRFKLLIEQSKRMPEHLFVQMLT